MIISKECTYSIISYFNRFSWGRSLYVLPLKGRFCSVTRRFESEIPRFFPKTLDFALLLKRLRASCGIGGKIVFGKKGKKGQFCQKSTLFEQKVDLK